MESNQECNIDTRNENGNDTNATTSPAASHSSVKSTRDANDVVEHPQTNDEQGLDDDNESSSSSEGDSSEEDEDSVDDPHLSEYGKMVFLTEHYISLFGYYNSEIPSLTNIFICRTPPAA